MSSAWQNPISFLCISKNTGFSQSDGKSQIFVPWLVIVSIKKHYGLPKEEKHSATPHEKEEHSATPHEKPLDYCTDHG